MNKKTVFDKHLYKEGLRMLLPFGAILLGLLSIFTILFCAGSLLDHGSYTLGFEQLTELVTIHSMILYFAIIVFVVPILTLKSFHFLTTRTGSDFYHSIPHKKQCIYITFASAAFTWVIICTIIPSALLTIVYAIVGSIALTFLQYINMLLHILVAALLVMSAISIACAITGTMISNIITTGLILFFPRIFLYAIRLILAETCNTFILGNGFWFGTRSNLVVQPFIGFENMFYFLFDIKPLIYSLLVCLVYVGLAIFLFKRRHSELAMKATLSRKLQAFLCLLLGTAFSIIPIAMICLLGSSLRFNLRDNVFVLVTIYILIIIAMGIYELITTKRVRNLVRIIPRVGILAVINIAIIGSMYCGKKIILSDVPNASSIKSVSFGFINPDAAELINRSKYDMSTPLSGDLRDDSMNYYTNEYFYNKCNRYSTSDETICKIVAKGLDAYANNQYKDRPHTILVTVNTGIRSMTRTAYLSQADFTTIRNYLLQNDEFMSNLNKLPKTNYVSLSRLYGSKQLTTKEICELYELASQEIQTLPSEELLNLHSRFTNDSLDSLCFISTFEGVPTNGNIPISRALPKTYDRYLTLINGKTNDMIKNAKDKLTTLNENQTRYDLDYTILNHGDTYFDAAYNLINSFSIKKEAISSFLDDVIANENNAIDSSKENCVILRFTYNDSSSKNHNTESTIKYVQMDQATLKHHLDKLNKLNTEITTYYDESTSEVYEY